MLFIPKIFHLETHENQAQEENIGLQGLIESMFPKVKYHML